MRRIIRIGVYGIVVMLASVGSADSMRAMNDYELGEITGQTAIQLSLRLHNNIEVRDDNHVALSHCNTAPGTYNPCRLGMEFVDKETNWLVMKEYYGYLNLTDIRLQGVVLPGSNTLYHDEDRFKREDGSCMITNCDPSGLVAIQMDYPSGKGEGEYLDMRTFMNVGRMTVETNDPAATYSDASNPYTPDNLSDFGFMQEQNQGVANAFRISDSTGPNANMQVRFDGRTLIYGF
ncbi:hypothetical protein [Alcanivorax nanhaiticus]|nr:hypothetical protein [Alcanivorax nanhaiticus]